MGIRERAAWPSGKAATSRTAPPRAGLTDWRHAAELARTLTYTDQALEQLAERMAEEADDLAWAKPYVDEARAEVARGNLVSREEHRARNVARLVSFKG